VLRLVSSLPYAVSYLPLAALARLVQLDSLCQGGDAVLTVHLKGLDPAPVSEQTSDVIVVAVVVGGGVGVVAGDSLLGSNQARQAQALAFYTDGRSERDRRRRLTANQGRHHRQIQANSQN